MIFISGWRATAISVMLSLLLMSACSCTAQPKAEVSSQTSEDSLRRFLQGVVKDKATRYIVAFRDLNDDGISEAIVYLLGREWCGSAGCNTIILRRGGDSWKMIANIRITRPPIAVLRSKSNGWHNITVHVQGGGVHPGYEAELRFDGESYPKNPSIPPARRVKTRPAEETVISSTAGAVALYPAH
jgi:hypothetical protein